MSSVYVYEDPCIGAVIEAVARIDYAFGGKRYRSVLKQTAGRSLRTVGDLVVGTLKSNFIVAEFKAPVLKRAHTGYAWHYRVRNVRSLGNDIRDVLYAIADQGGYYLALVHLFADVGSATGLMGNGLSHSTYVHAPLTTVFVPVSRGLIDNVLLGPQNTRLFEIRASCRARGRLRPWRLDRFPKASAVVDSYDYAIPGNWCDVGDRVVGVENPVLGKTVVVKGYSLVQLLKCLEQGRIGVGPRGATQLRGHLTTLASMHGRDVEWRNLLVLTGSLTTMDPRTLALYAQLLSEGG